MRWSGVGLTGTRDEVHNDMTDDETSIGHTLKRCFAGTEEKACGFVVAKVHERRNEQF